MPLEFEIKSVSELKLAEGKGEPVLTRALTPAEQIGTEVAKAVSKEVAYDPAKIRREEDAKFEERRLRATSLRVFEPQVPVNKIAATFIAPRSLQIRGWSADFKLLPPNAAISVQFALSQAPNFNALVATEGAESSWDEFHLWIWGHQSNKMFEGEHDGFYMNIGERVNLFLSASYLFNPTQVIPIAISGVLTLYYLPTWRQVQS